MTDQLQGKINALHQAAKQKAEAARRERESRAAENRRRYPEIAAFVDSIHDMGARVIGITNCCPTAAMLCYVRCRDCRSLVNKRCEQIEGYKPDAEIIRGCGKFIQKSGMPFINRAGARARHAQENKRQRADGSAG